MNKQCSPIAYPKPITLDSLSDLFAHHRSRFGGWRMVDDSGAGDDSGDKKDDGKGSGYTPPASQADLDRIISDRLAREREKYADYTDLKAKAAAHDATLEAAMTDAEKAVTAARKEGETTAAQAANGRIIRAEARALAAQAGFRSLADVSLLDLSDVKVGDDGEADSAAIKAKLDDLVKSDPWRIDDGKKPAPKSDKSQGGGGSADDRASIARGREMFAATRKKSS